MLFDKETRHWQEKYRNGEIPQKELDNTPGEILALLDGTAERTFWLMVKIMGSILVLGCIICLSCS